jgi:putative transposase
MNEHRDQYSLVLMCRVLKVARAGFPQWLHKPISDRAIKDKRLLTVIRNSYAASGGVYGARRVFGDLREADETCGKHRVERIMRANKIKAVRGHMAPRAISVPPSIIAPNRLNREFSVSAPNQVWVLTLPTSALGKAGFGCAVDGRLAKQANRTCSGAF